MGITRTELEFNAQKKLKFSTPTINFLLETKSINNMATSAQVFF